MKISIEKLRERMKGYRQTAIDTLSALVKIPSVSEETEDERAPFGEEVSRALELACTLAEAEGASRTVRCAHYAYADFGEIGEDTPYVGIFSHLDVVPAGEGWLKTEPFTPRLEGDILYGRGADDNKSGVTSALLALRALKAEGYAFKHPIRLYFGGNEESGMTDLQRFVKNEKNLPAVSLVPDGSFPLSLGEKGICRIKIKTPEVKDILDATGGVAHNVVTANARVTLAYKESLLSELEDKVRAREGYHLSYTAETIVLETVGIPAHASAPAGSKNAWKMAAALLASCRALDSSDRAICTLVCQSMQDDYGTALTIAHEDSRFGALTCTNGMLSMEEGRLAYCFDIRYGTELPPAQLEKKVIAKTESVGEGWECEILENRRGFHIEEGLSLTERLLAVYREASGKHDARPYYMRGGTYARCLPNAYGVGTVATYAGTRPTLPEGHGQIHGKDEYISIPMLLEACAIIAAMLVECDQSV